MIANMRGYPHKYSLGLALLGAALAWGCGTEGPTTTTSTALVSRSANMNSAADNPNFNLEVILRAPEGADGFGHVKFRQANDAPTVIDLGVWVRDLAPNAHYKLQRATDAVVDGNCAGTNWLTLGEGPVPQDVVTDDRGTGLADLFRVLTNPVGTAFDIHFRVIDTHTPANVVLSSDCYQFFVR